MTAWTVPARVIRVIDGDTIVADLDLGWNTWRLNQRIRLLGCDCPEMPTAAGKAARRFTEEALWNPYGSDDAGGNMGSFYPITVESHALDNFGRVLARVRWSTSTATGPGAIHDLTDDLIGAGHAVPR